MLLHSKFTRITLISLSTLVLACTEEKQDEQPKSAPSIVMFFNMTHSGSASCDQSGRCTGPLNNMFLGSRYVAMVNCKTATGTTVPCSSTEIKRDSTEPALVLQDGESFEIAPNQFIKSGETHDPDNGEYSFTNPPTTQFSAGGVLITVDYIEPELITGTSGYHESGVVSYSMARNSRICLAPTENTLVYSNSGIAGSACGHSATQYGDLLVDFDLDNSFNYLNETDQTTVSEATSRSDSYMWNAAFHTDGVFADSDGWNTSTNTYSILIPFDEIKTFEHGTGYLVTVTTDLSNAFIWMDGAGGETAKYGPYNDGFYDVEWPESTVEFEITHQH